MRRDDFPRTNAPFKKCSTCKVEKANADFHSNGRLTDGLNSHCRDCQKAKDRRPRVRFSQARSAAQALGTPWTLTYEQFLSILELPCDYCGSMDKAETGRGIDQVVPKAGYITENVVPCCAKCNRMKLNTDRDGLLLQVARIYQHSIARKIQ